MSRITSDKVNLGDSVVVDFFADDEPICDNVAPEQESMPELSDQTLTKINLLEKKAQDKAQRIVEEANAKSSQILSDASFEAEKIINEAQVKADELEKNANELIEKAGIQKANNKDTPVVKRIHDKGYSMAKVNQYRSR